MHFGSPDRWVILRFNQHGVSYRDDRGNKARARDQSLLPASIDALVQDSINLGASEYQVPAIFIAPNANYVWTADRLRASPALQDSSRYQFARLPARRRPWPSFNMPLRIVTIGSAFKRIAEFTSQSFVKTATEAGGLFIDNVAPYQIADIGRHAHVVVANEVDALTVLFMTANGWLRPRLVIVAAEHDSSSLSNLLGYPWLDDQPLRTSSVLFLPPVLADSTEQVLYGIVHDEPFHAIAQQLRRSSGLEPILVSDPGALHSLRISDAFAEALRGELTQAIGEVEPQPEELVGFKAEPAGDPVKALLEMPFNFFRESAGFVPIARSLSARESQIRRTDFLRSAIRAPEAPQRRRVDARIERVDTVPFDLQDKNAAEVVWLPSNRTLRNGGRYRLRLQIGRDFSGNLVSATVPSLDSLLPPTGRSGWDLEIVVFAKDFRLHSRSSQKLHLDVTGATDPLYFDIHAPPQSGPAQLRFAVYHLNHLLQSFLLDAIVTPEELDIEGALRVTLDLARTEAFSNLDTLKPRALSIGVNLDDDGSHRLLVKFDEIGREIPLENSLIDAPLRDFRDVLTAASVEGGHAVFPAEGEADTPEQRQAFEKTIRELARIGRGLHRALFDRGGHAPNELRQKFREIRERENATLQFARYDVNFAMPWSIFYDFRLPADPAQAAVCRGTVGAAACGHGPDATAICINGFWGTRHIIEEQLAGGSMSNAINRIERPKQCPPVCVSDGANDGYAAHLVTTLENRIAKGTASIVEAPQKVLDILWDASSRPSVMMFLGHLDETGTRRIQIPGTDQWLTAAEISDRALEQKDWTQPNSLVLLMACDAMQVNSTMLHAHALAFRGAGAPAVVGPECPVFTPFACRVARDIVLAMLQTQPRQRLGEAVTQLRRTLADEHNPLGFAFTIFGDADVEIA